ncbi:MAG: hypothetical protein OXC27_13655 [Caldilineaceae bacterium]|nr:hypothetical protein [Caldilineaceae bacterium]
MTSEVAVMNKEAVALAADSAVTFTDGTGQKIFTSASKIFTLSKYQPVGVMIYGNASFMGIPWESIIKIYRSRLGTDTFKKVTDYVDNFLAFLRGGDLLFSNYEEEQEEYLRRSVYWCFKSIRERIDESVSLELYRKREIEESVLESITTQIIKSEFDEWGEAEATPLAPTSFDMDLSKMYGNLILQAQSEVFEGVPLTEESSKLLAGIAFSMLWRFPSRMYNPESTGVVVAGFGTDEVFPVLESYSVEGRIDDYLKHRRIEKDCTRIGGSMSAAVLPFAQREMVDTFMAGVDPVFHLRIKGFVENLDNLYREIQLDMIYDPHDDFEGSSMHEIEDQRDIVIEIGEQLEQFLPSLSEHSQSNHIDPVISVVQGLPRDELAAMAESLINLTSFKRRVSMQAETVGGPIDVAVISKGDGFIWIKRKHYFEGDMNPQFFANYFR